MYEFEAELWRWKDNASWIFITVPEDVSAFIHGHQVGPRRGFGSVRVKVSVGAVTWKTSVFPQTADNYVLPIKKEVRVKNNVDEGDTIRVALSLLD